MLKTIMASLFVLSSFSVMAHVQEVAQEEASISSHKVVERANLKFQQCDQFRINALESSAKYLSKSLTRLQSEVENYPTKDLTIKEKKFLKKVSKKLSCVQKKISESLTFKCVDGKICETVTMYVQRILLVPNSLQKDVIHACDGSYFYSGVEISGVILHEATHLCGTNDLEYLLDLEEYNSEPQLSYNYKIKRKDDGLYLKKRILSVNGSQNADSYRYWYHNGFCMPGRDCE